MRNDGPLSRLLLSYARASEHPAKVRVLRWLGRHVFPQEGIVGDVMPGVRLLLHPRDWIEYQLLRGASYEPVTLEFLQHNLGLGQSALLAGVNFGLHLIVAARSVGPDGLVIGVEPQPASVIRATANLRLNGVEANARIVAAALGDEPALVPAAWASSTNTGAASLLDTAPDAFITSVLHPEQLWALFGGRSCRLVLLDVQGYEVKILSGLLSRERPDLIVCEVERTLLCRAGTSPEELTSLLVRSGYDLFDLVGRSIVGVPECVLENNLVGVRAGCDVSWP